MGVFAFLVEHRWALGRRSKEFSEYVHVLLLVADV